MKKKTKNDEIHNTILASYRQIYIMKKIMDCKNNKHNDDDFDNDLEYDDFQDGHYYRSNIPDKDQCAICYKKGFVTHTIHLAKEEINLCNKCFEILPEKLLSSVKVD